MPKMKTNSSAKKRFSVTGTGKLKSTQSGKQHLLRKKDSDAKRSLRSVVIVEGQFAKNILKYRMPYALKK